MSEEGWGKEIEMKRKDIKGEKKEKIKFFKGVVQAK